MDEEGRKTLVISLVGGINSRSLAGFVRFVLPGEIKFSETKDRSVGQQEYGEICENFEHENGGFRVGRMIRVTVFKFASGGVAQSSVIERAGSAISR